MTFDLETEASETYHNTKIIRPDHHCMLVSLYTMFTLSLLSLALFMSVITFTSTHCFRNVFRIKTLTECQIKGGGCNLTEPKTTANLKLGLVFLGLF